MLLLQKIQMAHFANDSYTMFCVSSLYAILLRHNVVLRECEQLQKTL